MKFIPPNLLLKNVAYAVLLLAAMSALYQLSARYQLQWDFTQSASNSLDSASVEVLKQLPGTINLSLGHNKTNCGCRTNSNVVIEAE